MHRDMHVRPSTISERAEVTVNVQDRREVGDSGIVASRARVQALMVGVRFGNQQHTSLVTEFVRGNADLGERSRARKTPLDIHGRISLRDQARNLGRLAREYRFYELERYNFRLDYGKRFYTAIIFWRNRSILQNTTVRGPKTPKIERVNHRT